MYPFNLSLPRCTRAFLAGFVADSGVNAASPDRRKSLTVRYDARAAVPDPKLTVSEDAPFVAHVAKNEVFDEVQEWRRSVPS